MKKQLIFALVFSFIIFGFGFADFAQATNNPIPGVDIIVKKNPGGIAITVSTSADGSYIFTGLTPGTYDLSIPGQPNKSVTVGADGKINGTVNFPGIGSTVGSILPGVSITPSDLGVDNVGTLPTSRFYFLKQWGRGIERLFTFNPVAKAELELTITNQIAAEMLAVEKANPDDTSALKKALDNYTNSQERLNMRIGKLPATTNPNVEKLLKNVDEKTAKQASLIEQLTEQHSGQLKFEVVDNSLKNAEDNTLKTFTFTVTNTGGVASEALNLKKKAEDQIKSALVAIEEANSALMQVSTTRGINVNPGGVDVRGISKQSIFDRWGNMIAKAKSNLDSAKKAFTEGKYGEAYGQARSAEAMVPVLASGQNFPDKKVDVIAPTTPSAETKTKLDTNPSPLPIDQKPIEQKDEPKTTPTSIELKSSTTIKGSAGSTSTTINTDKLPNLNTPQ